MNLTENTKVRIKVPKHLYESIQAELGKMEEKKDKPYYEIAADAIDAALSQEDTDQGKLDILLHIKDSATKKMKEMNPSKRKMEEGNYGQEDTVEEGEEMKEYVGMSDPQMQIVDILGQLIAGGALSGAILMAAKTLFNHLKNKMSKKSPAQDSAPMAEELEEVFDLDFGGLMEAMKDASKKKAEDKKKKEAEDKKKKEAEAKKKAAAVKKK